MQEKAQSPRTKRSRHLLRIVNDDLLAAGVLSLIGAISLTQTGDDIRNWVFPRAITYSLLAMAVVLAVRGIVREVVRATRQPVTTTGRVDSGWRAGAVDAAIFSIATIAYVVLIPIVGFWLTSFAMLTGASVFLSARRDLRVTVMALLVAGFLCLATYLLFLRLFFVPLPAGWFAAAG